MHIGALGFFDAAEWTHPGGAFRSEDLRSLLALRARGVPGLSQTLGRVPVTGWPIWIRDAKFDPARHVEMHAPVGSAEEVRAIAEERLALPLERNAPLWRIIVVPGVDGGSTFAVLFVAHHSLVDGIAGIDLLSLLLDRKAALPGDGLPHGPQPSPSFLALAEVTRWARLPALLGAKAIANFTSHGRFRRTVRRGVAFARTCVRLLSPGPKTSLRGANEGQRHVAWLALEERPIRHARRRLNGTPNDIILAAVAQAIAAMAGPSGRLPYRNVRAAVPVSFRTRAERYALGNRIGLMLTPLELRELHPGRRVARINRHTAIQKQRGDAEGYEVLTELTSWTGQWSQRLLHWLAGQLHSYGILVTNVPGPSRAYSLGGAAMQQIYPLVPLFGSQSVSVAVVRYGGSLHVGVTSSWPEQQMVEAFTAHLRTAFDELTRTPAPAAESAGQRSPARPSLEPASPA